jgi:hypothetical protein
VTTLPPLFGHSWAFPSHPAALRPLLGHFQATRPLSDQSPATSKPPYPLCKRSPIPSSNDKRAPGAFPPHRNKRSKANSLRSSQHQEPLERASACPSLPRIALS